MAVIQSKETEKTGPKSPRADFEYVEGIRSGDPAAFASLFRKYYEPLYQFAGRFVKDAQTSESIVQDVFVNIWKKREEWHVQHNVKSYLYTSVRNQSLNYLKREKVLISMTEYTVHQDYPVSSPEEALIEREMVEAVQKAIEKLPQQCRRIYLMKRYDDLKYSEIAEVLNISINTVKTQMRRALKSLHKSLAYLMSLFLGLY